MEDENYEGLGDETYVPDEEERRVTVHMIFKRYGFELDPNINLEDIRLQQEERTDGEYFRMLKNFESGSKQEYSLTELYGANPLEAVVSEEDYQRFRYWYDNKVEWSFMDEFIAVGPKEEE